MVCSEFENFYRPPLSTPTKKAPQPGAVLNQLTSVKLLPIAIQIKEREIIGHRMMSLLARRETLIKSFFSNCGFVKGEHNQEIQLNNNQSNKVENQDKYPSFQGIGQGRFPVNERAAGILLQNFRDFVIFSPLKSCIVVSE